MLVPKQKLGGKIPARGYGFLSRVHPGDRSSMWKITTDSGEEICSVPASPEWFALGRDTYRLLGLEDGSARIIRFADLHRHSDNSLLDGMTKIPDMVRRTEYAGALTDHGNMYGFMEYYKAMNKAGKKPIIGFEGYMPDVDGKLEARHVVLLAKTTQGYRNLVKMTSESFSHFYRKPHVTWELLEQYHEGVICLTACLGGAVPHALAEGDTETARATLERLIGIFGKDDLYVEIQNHHIDDEDRVRPMLIKLAEDYGLKVVATTDAHYPTEEDRVAHDVILCIQTKRTVDDPDRMKYVGSGYFLHNSEDMEERFREYPEALDNTLEIAEKCNVEIKTGDYNFPKFPIPEQYKSEAEYMTAIADEGFHSRFDGTAHEHDPAYRERFDYEVRMIVQMGFAAYFIIVWDFINYAKTHNIAVGPGRGSAAGSMVAYCMGITDLDPIKYNLLFERFLNPERISMPEQYRASFVNLIAQGCLAA